MTDFNRKNKLTPLSDPEERLEYLKSLQAVHWYVLRLPATNRHCADELEGEVMRRASAGEPVFEFFAPTYVPVSRSGRGKASKQRRYLLYNYVFIHSSVHEIFQLRQRLPHYNLLPRKGEGPQARYPYITDAEMERFKWVAQAYANQVPVIETDLPMLSRGDRVRITAGQFAGLEATLVSYNGSSKKDIVVRVEDLLWVPLLHVEPGQYELISLNEKSKHLYFQLDLPRYWQGLHTALCHHYTDEVDEADKALAQEVVKHFINLQVDTDVTQAKRCCLLILAYTILGSEKEKSELLGFIEKVKPGITSVHARALLATTLYGCTDNYFYYTRAHEIIDEWAKEEKPKKNKAQLIKRLHDYDTWLKH